MCYSIYNILFHLRTEGQTSGDHIKATCAINGDFLLPLRQTETGCHVAADCYFCELSEGHTRHLLNKVLVGLAVMLVGRISGKLLAYEVLQFQIKTEQDVIRGRICCFHGSYVYCTAFNIRIFPDLHI